MIDQGQIIQSLQKQLNNARKEIYHLKVQNKELRDEIKNLEAINLTVRRKQ